MGYTSGERHISDGPVTEKDYETFRQFIECHAYPDATVEARLGIHQGYIHFYCFPRCIVWECIAIQRKLIFLIN